MLVYGISISCRYLCTNAEFLPTPGPATHLVLGIILMGFVVATENVLRPRAYFSLWALAHFLEREVCLDHQVSQLRQVGMLSA